MWPGGSRATRSRSQAAIPARRCAGRSPEHARTRGPRPTRCAWSGPSAASTAIATSGENGARPTIDHLNNQSPTRKSAGPASTATTIWDCWQNGTKLDFTGQFYTFDVMTPFFDLGDDMEKENFERKFKDPDGIIFDVSVKGWIGTTTPKKVTA